jgi:cell division protein FtsQ
VDKPNNTYSFGRHELIVQRKAKKKIKDKLVFILLFLICNLSLLLFLRSPLFTIQEISVKGLDKLSLEEIRTVMSIREGMNIWKISPPDLQERILAIPRVARVEVERILPDKLFIHIQEKYPLALVPYHGYYLELASDGIFIGIRDDYGGELPLVNGLLWGKMDVGTSIADRSRGEVIESFIEVLKNTPSLPLAEINVENPQQIIVYTWEGMEVWLGNSSNLAKKLEVLQYIYHRLHVRENDPMVGYLDLRVAEAPVFRPIKK